MEDSAMFDSNNNGERNKEAEKYKKVKVIG